MVESKKKKGSLKSSEKNGRKNGRAVRPGHHPKPSRGITHKRDLVALVAELSFRNYNGEQVAHSSRDVLEELRRLATNGQRRLSLPMVEKLSTHAIIAMRNEAIKAGLVRVLLRLPEEQAQVRRLQVKVREAFGLRDVVLVPGFPDMMNPDVPAERRRNLHRDVRRDMAVEAAAYLDRAVELAWQRAPRGRYQVGVAWGFTMRRVADALRARPRPEKRPDELVFVPIIGITSNENRDSIEACTLAVEFAVSYNARGALFGCPAFVRRSEMDAVRSIPQIGAMMERIRMSDFVATGLGPIADINEPEEIRLSGDPAQSRMLFQDARAKAVGECCYWLFDREGQEVTDTEYTAMGLGFDGLREIAADLNRTVMLVVGGDARRIEPLFIALEKAKIANVLVSDTVTACQLLRRKERGVFSPELRVAGRGSAQATRVRVGRSR
jgi:DNA-binding transcriptional regulator LsrR (DeoR family)